MRLSLWNVWSSLALICMLFCAFPLHADSRMPMLRSIGEGDSKELKIQVSNTDYPQTALDASPASRPGVTDVSAGQNPSGMVLIPGGTNVGTDPEFGEYSLTVNSFYMDRYEVTKKLWDEVYDWANANGYSFDNAGSGKAANHPVHTVSWYDVVKWCNARSEKEGRPAVYTVAGIVYRTGREESVVQDSAAGYRLPTEIEWEYAARGGSSGLRFSWGDTIQHNRANYFSRSLFSYDTSPTRGYHPDYSGGSFPYTSPVGSFAPNGYGLHDMAGNVLEFCFDWYTIPQETDRVARGGGWSSRARRCRVADRYYAHPARPVSYVGFRTLRPASPADAP